MEKELFNELLTNAKKAAQHSQGKAIADISEIRVHVADQVDTLQIRKTLGMSQQDFAQTFGFSVRTLSSWERGERQPEAAARVLLRTIAHNPQAVIEANQAH